MLGDIIHTTCATADQLVWDLFIIMSRYLIVMLWYNCTQMPSLPLNLQWNACGSRHIKLSISWCGHFNTLECLFSRHQDISRIGPQNFYGWDRHRAHANGSRPHTMEKWHRINALTSKTSPRDIAQSQLGRSFCENLCALPRELRDQVYGYAWEEHTFTTKT